MKATVEERVRGCVALVTGAKPDTSLDSRTLDQLSCDYLEILEIFLAVEDEFGITIPEHEAEKIQTVALLINHVKQHARLQ